MQARFPRKYALAIGRQSNSFPDWPQHEKTSREILPSGMDWDIISMFGEHSKH